MDDEKENSKKRKEFSNWLQNVTSLNTTKVALHEYVLDTWETQVRSWSKDEQMQLKQFLKCVAEDKIKCNDKKTQNKSELWFCECVHPNCSKILNRLLDIQCNPMNRRIIWNSELCRVMAKNENAQKPTAGSNLNTLPEVFTRKKNKNVINLLRILFKKKTRRTKKQDTQETQLDEDNETKIRRYDDIFEDCEGRHIWCLANMFMSYGYPNKILNSGPEDTDLSMFFVMMKNCKLFETDDTALYGEIIDCRDRIHHSATNRMDSSEAITNFDTMMTLLQQFNQLQSCTDAISLISEMKRMTIFAIEVPDDCFEELAREALELKQATLEIEVQQQQSKRFSTDDMEGLLKEIKQNLDEIKEGKYLYYGQKATYEVIQENEEFEKKFQERNEILSRLKQENDDLKKQLDIEQKRKDPNFQFFEDGTSTTVSGLTPGVQNVSRDVDSSAADQDGGGLKESSASMAQKTNNPLFPSPGVDKSGKNGSGQRNNSKEMDTTPGNTKDKKRLKGSTAPYDPHGFLPGTPKPKHVIDTSKLESTDNSKLKSKSVGFVTGIVSLDADKIALCDFTNSCVGLLDLKHKKKCMYTISDLRKPWDLTSIPEQKRIAVTIPADKNITFLSYLSGTLSYLRSIKVDGECKGIAYTKGRLVVAYGHRVELRGLNGNVLESFQTSVLFNTPEYVAVSHCGAYIYVSEYGNNCVTKLALDGSEIAKYEDDNLRRPMGLFVFKDGSFLVCSSENGEIHYVSSACMKRRYWSSNVAVPQTLCYNDETKTLFLCDEQEEVHKYDNFYIR